MVALKNGFVKASAALALVTTPFMGPLTGHAAEPEAKNSFSLASHQSSDLETKVLVADEGFDKYGLEKAKYQAGGLMREAGNYSEDNPTAVAVFVKRGDLDLGLASNERIERNVRMRLAEAADLSDGSCPPAKFYFIEGANEDQTLIKYFVNGIDVQIKPDDKDPDSQPETIYQIARALSPEVTGEVMTSVRAALSTLFAKVDNTDHPELGR